jgi:hypothetical protein
MKQQFFVSDNDADRCKEAFRLRKPISVSGVDFLDRQVKEYTGVVISVQYSSGGPPGEQSALFFCARIDDLGRYEVSLAHRREPQVIYLVEADLRANRPGRTPAMGSVHGAYENPFLVSIATDRTQTPRAVP